MIEIFLLEQFAAVARYGTLSRAAMELHISQPALSRSMKKLEEELGIPLFHREKSRISLNENGKFAVEYARRVLEADREFAERTLEFERRRRTVALGACASLPINELMPVLQECFKGMAINCEIREDHGLLLGLRNQTYQLAVLHESPKEEGIFFRPYMEEHLAVSFPSGHALASEPSVTFKQLDGLSILAHGGAGFWLEICREQLKESRLLVQDSMESLEEIVDASALPVFHSDRAAKYHRETEKRVIVPIADEAAGITYYLACLDSEREKYRRVFQKLHEGDSY